ncbi:hypothetical protein niasHT_031777 [Heterodera trifolii]|uniref:Uncharacterized protein n=1 Tax=Heterodera trifolii TaxID=157864 RepID=A0ABD2ITE0_9BILA
MFGTDLTNFSPKQALTRKRTPRKNGHTKTACWPALALLLGVCKQRYRNFDALQRVTVNGQDEWRPTTISTACCCDCKAISFYSFVF